MRAAWIVCLAAMAGTSRAEAPPSRTIVLHAAKPPSPALRVRLLPSPGEQIPGDAAVFYHRALENLIGISYREEIQAIKAGDVNDVASGMNASDAAAMKWLELPSEQFPRAEARTVLDRRRNALDEARQGSLRETCDWGFRRREEGFSLLLPEIQDMQGLTRWIALQARLDAEEGRIDAALSGLKTGLAVALDIGRSDIYIQSLVAISCASTILDRLESLIQQPGCPNLYWALAALPRPLMDLSGPAFGEAELLEREFPMIRRLDGDAWSLETARACGDLFAGKLGQNLDGWPRAQGPLSRPSPADIPAHAFQLLAIAKGYRGSMQALRDGGAPAARLEAMPMIQVVALDSYRKYQAVRDEIVKWSYLPYWLASSRWAVAEREIAKPAGGFPFIQLLPSIRSAHIANVRLERRVAALMVVEAVRLHAATHDGTLPTDLGGLTEVPAPHDPARGEPFAYRVEGDRALLEAPAPVGWEGVRDAAIRYELRISR